MRMLINQFKNITKHALFQGSAVVALGSVATNLLAYLYHMFVGRILGPIAYGELAALLSLFYILNVPSLVLQNILTKFFSIFKARNQIGQAKQLFMQATKYIIAASAVGLLVVIPLSSYISPLLKLDESVNVVLLYLIVFSFFLTIVSASALQGFQMFFPYNVYAIIGSVFRLLFGIITAFFGVGWVLVGNIVSNCVSYFFYFITLKFLFVEKSQAFVLPKDNIVSYSIPAFLSMLGITAIYSQDVLLVKYFFSPQIAGTYSALSILGKIIFYASSAVGIVLFPVVAERNELKQTNTKLVNISILAVAGISLLVTLLYFLVPDMIISVLFGKAFLDAAVYLGHFGIFLSLFSLSFLLINSYLAQGLVRVWIFSIVASVLQVVLYVFFHTSLMQVIWINIAVSGGLLVSLLFFRHYAR